MPGPYGPLATNACRLLERLHRHQPGHRPEPQAEALLQIVVHNCYRQATGVRLLV
ncbi:hypothetical protein [Streptomyces flaveolus]|uniref:hypothetical protein n=1 Tax=Streptomyces flaveolus TaxID=67297 RepID=UPI00332EF8D5